MPHVDPEILAGLALDSDAGSAADRSHLAACASCRAELARLTRVVATGLQAGFGLQTPPARVWDRVLAEIEPDAGVAAASGLRPAAAGGGNPVIPEPRHAGRRRPGRREARRPEPRSPRRWRRPLAVGAAGLLAAAGVAVSASLLTGGSGEQPASVVAQVRLRPLPQFPQWRSASATAVLERTTAGQTLDVALHAPARPGFYEVWLLGRNGVSMISLGDLNSAHTGRFNLPPGVSLSFYSRIDISLQPYNGSTAHVKASVVRGSL